MASQNAKKMAKEFLQNVEKDSKSYHKSWARKFGNKYQSAKNWVKRDKKMVAMDIAQKRGKDWYRDDSISRLERGGSPVGSRRWRSVKSRFS